MKYRFNYLAKQAAGSCFLESGNTRILAAVAVEPKGVDGDFLPLAVQYIEKTYAAGKFPGGFIKREGKPSELETLTSRLIDRTLRPLFPKSFCYPTQISIFVLSADPSSDLPRLALNAASSALYTSSIPLQIPANAVRIGRKNGELILNPNAQELENSEIDLFVSGAENDLLMIEMVAQKEQISEDELLLALQSAQNAIAQESEKMKQQFLDEIKEPLIFQNTAKSFESAEITNFVKENYTKDLEKIISKMAKTERNTDIKILANNIAEIIAQRGLCEIESAPLFAENALNAVKRQIIRTQILEQNRRADGRGLEEVRPICIETNILPQAHGSALFTRGQTQALVVATLGGENDAQSIEKLCEKSPQKEKFFLHYNFPPFSVGEAGNIGSPGRRELGHGNLAKRALISSILEKNLTIRLVSEILESNGSSSMASVCGGSLALAAAGVECSELIAGVAMGLVCEGEKYAILSDIMGLEDHDGDMDFKVAGSRNGISALQMDIKLGGLSMEILQKALAQAKRARAHILDIMEEAAEQIVVNEKILPSIQIFSVPPFKIPDIIGTGGKVIKELIERFCVNIDLEREKGEVRLMGADKSQVEAAKSEILRICADSREARYNGGSSRETKYNGGDSRGFGDSREARFNEKAELKAAEIYKVGEVLNAKVKKILDFGAFLGLERGMDGLLHISKIRQNNANLSENTEMLVKITKIDEIKNKIDLDFA